MRLATSDDAPLPRLRPRRSHDPRLAVDFATFVLLNAVLYIRPMDFVPGLVGLPLYNIAFCICFFFNLPALLEERTFRSIALHPVSLCVLGVFLTSVLSNLLQGLVEEAYEAADWYFKICLYYTLLVCVVRTPTRMKWLLASLVVDGCIVAGIGVADYMGLVEVPNLVRLYESHYVDGEEAAFRRLAGTGLFGDPNDLSLMIVGCVIYSAYLLGDKTVSPALRAVWLAPLPLLFHTLTLTFSRGGALSLMVGVGIYALLRFRWRALPLGLLALPLVLRGGGRQVDFDVTGGTGQARIMLWNIYIELFLAHPVLGVGFSQWDDHTFQVAHNSYLHVFAERGFPGGMCFLSAFLLAIWSLVRMAPSPHRAPDEDLVRQRRFLLASVGSYAVGIMTLSRNDVIPTYTILGLAVAFERMVAPSTARGPMRLTPKLIALMAAVSVAYMCVMYVYVKRNLYW